MAKLYDLKIDCSDVTDKMNKIRNALTEDRFQKVMRSEFHRVGAKVRKITGEDLPKDYEVKSGYVKKFVKHEKVSFTGNGVNCTIPINGPRGTIGGTYKAKGGAHGWNIPAGGYKVSAKMVKGKNSVLPTNMDHQGGNRPFRNTGAKKLKGAAFVRKGKARFPIVHVSGIGVPQMPLNKSRTRMEDDIIKLLDERMDHVWDQIMAGVIK